MYFTNQVLLKGLPNGKQRISFVLSSPGGRDNHTQTVEINVKKKKLIRAKIVRPFFRGPYRRNILNATSMKINVASNGFQPGRDGFIAALVDGTASVYSVSNEVVVSNLLSGQHSITVQCVDSEKHPISRSKTDTILFTVKVPTMLMKIVRPKPGELFNGGTVPLALDISGERERHNCLAAVTLGIKGKETKVFPLTHPVIDLKNLPSGIHKVTITLFDLNFAPIFDPAGNQMVRNVSFGYFIDEVEEKKRSDENIMKQLLFLDLIGGKISKEEMPAFLQNYINSDSNGAIEETDGETIGVRYSYGDPDVEKSNMLEAPNPEAGAQTSALIKCKFSFSNGGGKKLLLMPGDATIGSLAVQLVKKFSSLKDIVITDKEDFDLDISTLVIDYAQDGTAYFNVQNGSQ
jgi:hypothetical protein